MIRQKQFLAPKSKDPLATEIAACIPSKFQIPQIFLFRTQEYCWDLLTYSIANVGSLSGTVSPLSTDATVETVEQQSHTMSSASIVSSAYILQFLCGFFQGSTQKEY